MAHRSQTSILDFSKKRNNPEEGSREYPIEIPGDTRMGNSKSRKTSRWYTPPTLCDCVAKAVSEPTRGGSGCHRWKAWQLPDGEASGRVCTLCGKVWRIYLSGNRCGGVSEECKQKEIYKGCGNSHLDFELAPTAYDDDDSGERPWVRSSAQEKAGGLPLFSKESEDAYEQAYMEWMQNQGELSEHSRWIYDEDSGDRIGTMAEQEYSSEDDEETEIDPALHSWCEGSREDSPDQ